MRPASGSGGELPKAKPQLFSDPQLHGFTCPRNCPETTGKGSNLTPTLSKINKYQITILLIFKAKKKVKKLPFILWKWERFNFLHAVNIFMSFQNAESQGGSVDHLLWRKLTSGRGRIDQNKGIYFCRTCFLGTVHKSRDTKMTNHHNLMNPVCVENKNWILFY